MSALRRFFGNWWVLSVLAAILAALILTLALPLLIHPLRPLIWRLVLLGAVILAWAGFAAFRIFAARQASDRIADALARERSETASEGAVVGQRMAEALSQLRSESGRRRDYLYSRPWYVIVGPPGAGKTTAILNSGLRFPFTDRSVKGVGGTRNLDFWFADEAVIVDTAGRYHSQDSSESRDREGWIRFLDLLRKNRPLQPINGVIVALGVDTLLTGDVAEIDRHADTIRRRLLELREGLEVSVPVYVVFTKSDLMAGFTEFFEDLDVEQRRAVVGSTFDADGAAPDAARIARAFDQMTEALDARTPKRLQDELDMRRRGLILGFASQIAGLRNAIARLLDGAFPHDAREGPARLRGFYFTSGVQQGAPLDRLMGATAAVYDAPPPAARSGRAYFLNRLLMDVMFAEAGLVEGTAGAKARRGAMLTTGLVATAIVASLVLLAWIGGFTEDLRNQDAVARQAGAAAADLQKNFSLTQAADIDPRLELETALADLNTLRNLPGGYEQHSRGATPFADWIGLGDAGLGADAQSAYLAALQRIMAPRLLFRMEDAQRALLDPAATSDAGGELFAPLKAYLILGGEDPHGFDAKAVKGWVTGDWAADGALAGVDKEPERAALALHLDALLADKDLGQVWPHDQTPLDQDIIDKSRHRLASVPVGDRLYALLKAKAGGSGHDWTIEHSGITDDMLAAFANGPDLRRLSVPYLFTQDGYKTAYRPALIQVAADMAADNWVLGPNQDLNGLREGARQDVPALYAREYIATWTSVLKAAQPANYFTDRAAADAMLAAPSPFKLLLKAVADQTTFVNATTPVRLPGPLSGLPAAPDDTDAVALITQSFTPLAQYISSGKVDTLLSAIQAAVGSDVVGASPIGPATGLAPTTATQSIEEKTEALETQTIGAPEVVRDFVNQIGDTGKTAGAGASVEAMRNNYVVAVKDACDKATAGFPFAPNATADADMNAVGKLFGQGGPFDALWNGLQSHLEDPAAPTWRWKAEPGSTLDPESAERLQQAQAIETVLQPLGMRMQIVAVAFAPGVTSATLQVGDTVHTFTAGERDPYPFIWSPTSNGVARLSFAGQASAFDERGAWALFRLFSHARVTSAASGAVNAQFGGGGAFVAFKVILPPGVRDPFVGAPGGPWAFRCPGQL